MAFTSESASEAGKKSKRGKDELTMTIKQAIANVVAGQLEMLEIDLAAMAPKDRWDVITKLSEYAIPKLARIQTVAEMPDERIVYENVSKSHAHGE